MAGGRAWKRMPGREGKKYAKGMEGSLVKDVMLWQRDTGLGREGQRKHMTVFPFEDFSRFFLFYF